MSVRASPLAASYFTRAVLSDDKRRNTIDDRLSALGRDVDWLERVAERYEQNWLHSVANAYMDSPEIVAEEWALLLSWLCDPFRMSDPSVMASGALAAVTQEYLDRHPHDAAQRLRPTHRPGLYAWVVGRPVGDVHIQLGAALLEGRQAACGMTLSA